MKMLLFRGLRAQLVEKKIVNAKERLEEIKKRLAYHKAILGTYMVIETEPTETEHKLINHHNRMIKKYASKIHIYREQTI